MKKFFLIAFAVVFGLMTYDFINGFYIGWQLAEAQKRQQGLAEVQKSQQGLGGVYSGVFVESGATVCEYDKFTGCRDLLHEEFGRIEERDGSFYRVENLSGQEYWVAMSDVIKH